MILGLVGKKIGMSRVFSPQSVSVPVTVIQVLPNKITQVKKPDSDGYSAIQITTGTKKTSRVTKPLLGHYAKSKVEPGEGLWEFRVPETNGYKVGSEITVDFFADTSFVDVISTSKGKGFAGVIKRHNFSSQDATHGNSLSHNVPGSIGQRQSPGKVFKGKKMAGHLGNKRVTVQNLKLVKVDTEKNLLLISGGVPGSVNSYIIITPAKKIKGESKS